jgi:hypothetical protein
MLGRVWRQQRGLAIGFLVAVAVTLFFLVRTVTFAIYWADPARQDQGIEGWMPLRYVARSWDVPPEVLGEALGLAPQPGARLTVEAAARAEGRDVEAVAADLRAAIEAFRAADGPSDE